LWIFVETLNVQTENEGRIRKPAWITALFFVVALVCGRYWYVHFYSEEKAICPTGNGVGPFLAVASLRWGVWRATDGFPLLSGHSS